MTMQYTAHDRNLVTDGLFINIVAAIEAPGKGRLGKDCPPSFIGINRLKKEKQGSTLGEDIKFQFPPKIVDDSQEGRWDEDQNEVTADTFATYKGAGPRRVTVDWTYIVTKTECKAADHWTPQVIHRQLRILRGYWRNSMFDEFQSRMVIYMRLWGLGGEKVMSFRMHGLTIKHGPTLVGVGLDAFPLRTDVSSQFRMWPEFDVNKDVKGISFVPGMRRLGGKDNENLDWF